MAVGCQTNKRLVTSFPTDLDSAPTLGDSFLSINTPDECDSTCASDLSHVADSISPNAVVDYQNISYTPISLTDCIERALADSEVFRKLGGTIVSQPTSIETALDPALVYADPLIGEQAALSAFDTNVAASLFFENNDRPFNNRFSGNTDGILVQDLGEYQLEFTKLAATGTLFTARQTVIYDNNNQAGNRFQGSAWEAIVDAGFRHPLLQGGGTMFNRIAGPSQVPGQYNGVLIARTNTEIGLAEFEAATREFVANVENAYWDLYYAYKELNAQTDARDAAYEVLKRTKVLAEAQRIPGLELASAKEQYLRFESAIIESLEGRTIDGTQANSGMTGGSFRRTVGVRTAERRLRYLIGMPITDGTLLQPSEVPSQAAIVFDWDQAVQAAVTRRPETRRQRWVLKQKELELTASRNFLKPRLDLVGNYRFRGLGKSLTGGGETLRDDIINSTQESGAFSDLAGGDFQELQLGAELRMPVGYRQANAGVRSAELEVQRARKILEEQERKILLDLSNAIAETRRAHAAMDIAKRRFEAAVQYRDQAADRVSNNRSQMDVLLEAQRRILESQLQYINAEVEYTQAIKNVHFEKASYLQYHGIALQESQSDPKAYADAALRYSKRSSELNYVVRDATIARGAGTGDAPIIDGSAVDNGNLEVMGGFTTPPPVMMEGSYPFSDFQSNQGMQPYNFEVPVPAEIQPLPDASVPATPNPAESPSLRSPSDMPLPQSFDGTTGAFWTPPQPTAGASALPGLKTAVASSLEGNTRVTRLGDLPKAETSLETKPVVADRLNAQVRLSDQSAFGAAETDVVAVKQRFFDGPLDNKSEGASSPKTETLTDAKPEARVASAVGDDPKPTEAMSISSSRRQR